MPTNQAAAKVTVLNGKAYVERNGTRITLTEGADVFAADSVITDSNGGVELVFRDNAVIKLGPGSQVNVQDFVYDGEHNPSFAIELATGVMQSLSGEVVKQNPAAFKISTPRASIGIRGTETYHSVQGDTETHAVIHISEGHIVMLSASDGRSITLASAMQAVSLRGDNQEALTIRSFQSTEMDSLQDALRDVRQPGERGKPENLEGPDAVPNTTTGDDSAQNTEAQGTPATSTVVQDEIRVLIVAEADTETIVTLVQDSLQNLQDSGNILIDSPVLSPLDTPQDGLSAGNSVVDSPPVLTAPAPNPPEMNIPESEGPGEPPLVPPTEPETPPEPEVPEDTTGRIHTLLDPLNDTFTAGAGNDTINVREVQSAGIINAGKGHDIINLDPNQFQGTINAGDGNDSISISISNGGTVNGGEGIDELQLRAGSGGAGAGGAGSTGANVVHISGVENVKGWEWVHDTVIMDNADSAVTFKHIEHIVGSSGNDSITIEDMNFGGTLASVVDTGAGHDNIHLTSNLAANGTINAGEGDDYISIGGIATGTVNGGGGNDTLQLGSREGSSNSVHISEVEHVYGGIGHDTVIMGDTNNTVTLKNVENIQGGSGNDNIKIIDDSFAGSVTAGAGNDTITVDHLGSGASSVYGGAGSDRIELGTWADGATLNVDLTTADSDHLKFLNGATEMSNSGVNGSSNWHATFADGSGGILTITFEGISSQEQYNALKSQIEGLSGTL